MASLNRVTFVGNLGKDPEIRVMNSGDRVANFSMAMTEKWRDKTSGEQKEKTEWANIVVWGNGLVEVVEKYLHKGSRILLEGKYTTRKYTDQAGADKWTTEVVVQGMNGRILMLDGKRDDAGGGGGERDSYRQGTGGGHDAGYDGRGGGGNGYQGEFTADLDDEIPF